MLTGHCSPKQLEIAHRSKFYNRSRKLGENISSYVAELRASVKHCKFGGTLDARSATGWFVVSVMILFKTLINGRRKTFID